MEPEVTLDSVHTLARYASLPLTPERLKAVESILVHWIPAANDLSRKMSAKEYQTLIPVTCFIHSHECVEDQL